MLINQVLWSNNHILETSQSHKPKFNKSDHNHTPYAPTHSSHYTNITQLSLHFNENTKKTSWQTKKNKRQLDPPTYTHK